MLILNCVGQLYVTKPKVRNLVRNEPGSGQKCNISQTFEENL